MRPLALLLAAALSAPAVADEVDLTPRSRREGRPPSLVVRAEGGSDFAPYGYVGGCLSYLFQSGTELEAGAGGGFPGVQFGFAARQLFGERGGYFVTEVALAGNSRVNRGASDNDKLLNAAGTSSLWGSLGFGFEQRQEFFSFSVVGSLVSTFANPSIHFAVHGGIGFGF